MSTVDDYVVSWFSMRAVIYRQPGGPEVLTSVEVTNPKPQAGEALVRVRACALNHLDVWLRTGRRNVALPHIMGSDVAGDVVELNGRGSVRIGDAVVVNPAIPCGACARCRTGKPCELVKIFGAVTPGGYAEQVTVPIAQLYPKPSHLSYVEAAAFPLTYLTAWHMLVSRANLQRGETVFIWGASGGLGAAAVQLARSLGAVIIAAVRTPAVAARLLEMGATHTVLYTDDDVLGAVRDVAPDGVDVVFESVGAKTWATSFQLLRPYGRVVIAGTTSGDQGYQDLSDLYVRQLTVLGARMGTREEFEAVVQWVNRERVRPIIAATHPIGAAGEAHRQLECGGFVGKIVLEV